MLKVRSPGKFVELLAHNSLMKITKTYWARAAIGVGLLFAAGSLVLSMPLVSDALIDQLQTFPALTAQDLESVNEGPPAAIVILAAGRRAYAPEFGGETLDALSLERIRYGADLARRTGLPVLVSGGLHAETHPTLAALMANTLLRDYGIETNWQEGQSRTTAENAIYSAEILDKAGIHTAILVTHAWHMKRARAAFVGKGMSVIPAPTAFYGHTRDGSWHELVPDPSALRTSGFAIHEIVGGHWYALRYGF
jgi:uncharacterized SAM-binding protein YcdF (DUF218 family)